MIDTGNQLLSPIKRESIILINLKIPIDKVIYVPYKALNTTGVIPCFRADKVVIDEKIITNCLIGIATDKINLDGVNCILPNILKEIYSSYDYIIADSEDLKEYISNIAELDAHVMVNSMIENLLGER